MQGLKVDGLVAKGHMRAQSNKIWMRVTITKGTFNMSHARQGMTDMGPDYLIKNLT